MYLKWSLFPKIKIIFKVGLFYSEDYANAVCAKYITLGLFTNSLKVIYEENTQ